MTSDYQPDAVTGLILAGGQGQRMGGADKGLLAIDHRPMLEHILDALRPQVGRIIINANRNLDQYASYGHDVVSDASGEFLGPLAGMEVGLREARSQYVLTVPCDSPLVTPDLGPRLWLAAAHGDAHIAVAKDGERLHPVFALIDTALHSSLIAFLESGQRKIDRWFEQHNTVIADFSDAPSMFLNVNRPDDLANVEAMFSRGKQDPKPQ
ncbi:MAG: molybdenum cofactor guanylyltransferase MobA [Pseudomonadota bacterium]